MLDKKNKVLDMITAPAIHQCFQSYLDYDRNVQYLAYLTKPQFDLKINKKL